MLIFLLSMASFLFLLSKSLVTRLGSWFSQNLEAGRTILAIFLRRQYSCSISAWKKMAIKRSEEREEGVAEEEMSILDLPELALDCILERLPPSGLCTMSGVCRSLKERCRNDHLWERHLAEKWGRVIGKAAVTEWKSFAASTTTNPPESEGRAMGLVWAFLYELPFPFLRWIRLWSRKPRELFDSNSAMSWYLAIERGQFWVPAQVYNREHGHSGFMMSCYDADLRYDGGTDTFKARYPPHGRRAVVFEDVIPWERIRARTIDTSPHDLHPSESLNELHPGDHFEIQWRRNKEFPYGWWYGVVGHLETCDGSKLHCRCHKSDTIALEFNHYASDSRWRRTMISRGDHRESGNESDGFYGGIRKLHSKTQISEWRRLWPGNNSR